MRTKLLKLEIMGSIWWMLMDMWWMFDFPGYALFLAPLVLINVVIGYKWTQSRTERKALLITFFWLVMNTLWMICDLVDGATTILVLKCVAGAFGLIGFGMLILWMLQQLKHEQKASKV